MVGLRSGRQDRALLLMVWALTVVVLALGVLTLSPILLVWGVIGLPAAILLSYIHVRDTRPARRVAAPGPAPGASADGDPAGTEEADGFEEESSR